MWPAFWIASQGNRNISVTEMKERLRPGTGRSEKLVEEQGGYPMFTEALDLAESNN
jgi:hypothetical protein